MTRHTTILNGHLELEIEKNPNRSYFATLRGNQPQFSPDNLLAEIQVETEHWMARLTGVDAPSFLQALKSIQHIFDALKHEARALTGITKALTAHGRGEWGEASKYYAKALSDLHYATSDWNFAIHEVADDTPFDPYYPSKEERAKHDIEEPPRASYEDMRKVSVDLSYLSQYRQSVLHQPGDYSAADDLPEHLYAGSRNGVSRQPRSPLSRGAGRNSVAPKGEEQ